MRIFLATIFVFLSACAISSKNQERAQLYMQIGNDHIEQKNYPEALVALQEAEKFDPENPYILNSLSQLYFAREKYDVTLSYLLRAIKILPKYTDAKNNLARLHIALGQYDKAIRELKLILKDLTYPQPEKIYTHLGLAYLRKNEFNLAKQNFMQALKIKNDHCPAYNEYGQTLMKLNEYDAAAGVFNKALSICDSSMEETFYLRAINNYKSGKKDMAISRLQELAKQYPTSEYAEKSRALLKVIEQEKL